MQFNEPVPEHKFTPYDFVNQRRKEETEWNYNSIRKDMYTAFAALLPSNQNLDLPHLPHETLNTLLHYSFSVPITYLRSFHTLTTFVFNLPPPKCSSLSTLNFHFMLVGSK